MANQMGQPTPLHEILDFIQQFFKDGWPMITAIAIAWKTIDKIAAWLAKKQDARLKLLIDAQVTPQITELRKSIEDLTKMIGVLENKLKT